MSFQAVGEYITVIPEVVKEKTSGGVIFPDEHRDRAQYKVSRAKVHSIGDRAFIIGDQRVAGVVKEGATIIYGSYEGSVEKGADGVEYRFLRDDQIMGVVTNE